MSDMTSHPNMVEATFTAARPLIRKDRCMSSVFILSPIKQPLMPCSPRRARLLLSTGHAAVFRRYPFTLILKPRVPHGTQMTLGFDEPARIEISSGLRLKIDPGSKTSGLALVHDTTGQVMWAAEITHRGRRIRALLEARRMLRRGRRYRKTRYRQPRFLNRRRPDGWLPPSLESRLSNVLTWVARLRRLCPIRTLSQELVRFDTQLMQDAEVSGVGYQQGTLAGYEVREYLLEKWARTCVYCRKTDIPLEIEHIIPKSRGGSDRVSNLTLACHLCNQRKGNQTAAEFGYPTVQAQGKHPLKDAAAVNTTRWALYRRLVDLGLPVEVGTGGRTKWNRTSRGLPKTHWIDAACIGASTPQYLIVENIRPLMIKAMGHGSRQMCTTDKYGFPKSHKHREKTFMGFQTGDMVQAKIAKGKYRGEHFGRVVIRFRPDFILNGFNVHPKYLRKIQQSDGYAYA